MSGLVEERGRRWKEQWEEECGKDGAEVEIQEGLDPGLRQGQGRTGTKGAWVGLGWVWAGLWVGWKHKRQDVADKDGAVDVGNPRRVGLSSFMAEARLPFESLP